MKRNKHVLINLTYDQYKALCFIAYQQKRKISDAAYLLIIETLNNELLKSVDINTEIKKLDYFN